MQVAQKNDPSRQREDTEQSAHNETRACDLRSCIETFAKENAKEATGNRAEQDCESGLFQRHTQEERYRKAESRLEHGFAQDSPADAPVQIYALCICNQACHEQGCALRRPAESRQALIKINWHVELDDGSKHIEHGCPEYGFLESSPHRRANASRGRQCPTRTGFAFENRKRDWGDRNRTDREADRNADGGLRAINSQQQRNTYSGMIRKSKRQRQDGTVCSRFFAEIPRRIVGRNKDNQKHYGKHYGPVSLLPQQLA